MDVSAGFGVMFGLLWLIVGAAIIAGGVLIVVAVWRAMKAHESIAVSARFMVEEMTRRNDLMQRPPGTL